MSTTIRTVRTISTLLAAAGTIALAACGHGNDTTTTGTANGDVASQTPEHHSKLKGAAVGAVAGHLLGGHAVAGAAAGALVQHERNKQ